MVTVLFIAAALTAVSSVAAYSAIHELRSNSDDQKAAASLSFAEAGIDRLMLELKRGKYTWNDIREAGCDLPPLQLLTGEIGVASGTYDVEMVAFDPFTTGDDRFPPNSCTAVVEDSPKAPTVHYFAVTSSGRHPDAKRIIRQVIAIEALDLPIGVYADVVATNGNPNFINISLISPGSVTQREKMSFTGTDTYYFLRDFWGDAVTDSTSKIPAAVHALGHIFLKTELQNRTEHTDDETLNCEANGTANGQSQWDQSGDGGTITLGPCPQWTGTPLGPPPTSEITSLSSITPKPTLSDQDYLTLRGSARQTGLYCFIPTAGVSQCTKEGLPWTPAAGLKVTQADVDSIDQTNFVAYFEFENSALAEQNKVSWDGNVEGCRPSAPGRSVVLVARQGGVSMEAGRYVNGALLAPDGTVSLRGGATLNGTIIAKKFDTIGDPTMQLNECWIKNMPGPFLQITPAIWNEIDR